MAVKAQSTITLARTDDGKTSYIHTVYLMPDGTFTKVLPGENLMTGGKEFIAESTNYTSTQRVVAGSFNLDLEKLNKERCLTVSAYISVKNSQRINPTDAFRIGYEGSVYLSSGNAGYIGVWHNGLIGETFSGFVKSIYKLPDGVTATNLRSHGYIYHQQNGEYLEVSHLKIEYGNNPDPIYTPSPQDDPINAYPAKEGTYSDFNAEGSDNPDDYVWKPFNVVSQVEWQEKISHYDTVLEPDNITASVTTSKTWEKFKQDEIDSKADKETVDGMGSELSNVGDLLNATQKQVGQMQIQSDNITQSIQTVAETVTAQGAVVKDVTDYMSFKTTGLEIGKSDSPFKTNLSNEELAFLENGEKVSYINGRTQYITKVEVTEEFRIGNHVAKKDEETGQTIFYWKG